MGKIKTIGIMTSGGDAPGMNAAIRAVTRAGICNGFKIKGIYRGYDGLINNEIADFTTENVSGIIMSGGTVLKTARSKEFTTPEGRQKAYDNMVANGIDALVVIGGNGSLTGAMLFAQEHDVCCIGLPGTIDNDLYGTDSTIGYDTTLNAFQPRERQLQHARPRHLPHKPLAPSPSGRQVVHLPDVRLRPPHRGRDGAHHALALLAGV